MQTPEPSVHARPPIAGGAAPEVALEPLRGNVPILLLPIRLESRFADTPQGPELWLRVYPTPISIDALKRELTSAEIQAGQAYWTGVWNAAQDPAADPKAPWRSLASRYRPQRAAWIARQTRPASFDPKSPLVFELPSPTSAPYIPGVAALPDQWVAFLWDTPTSATPQTVLFPNRINHALKAALDPQASTSADPATVAIDPAARWMVDFGDAVAQGMAATVSLTPTQRQQGFARVVVLGLRTSVDGVAQTPELGAIALQDLLSAHHYTDGLAFVPQGTPTKNTPDASTGYSRQDPGFETSYATEQGPSLMQSPDPSDPSVRSDGQWARDWLELPAGSTAFDHVQYADGLDQQDAHDMAVALWPATLGYFLRQMVGLQTPQQLAAVDEIRTYFVNEIRARGPVPALRIGDTPYGVLPVTSLRFWRPPSTGAAQTGALRQYLLKALPIWQQSYEQHTPRVGKSTDPDTDLAGILGMDASSTSYQGRYVLGPEFLWNMIAWFGLAAMSSAQTWFQYIQMVEQSAWWGFGLGSLVPYPPILQTAFAPGTWPVPGPLVQDEPLSETDPLPASSNYIQWLLQAQSIDDIRDETYTGSPPSALLYRLLRQSLLLEYANSGDNVLLSRNLVSPTDTAEAELVNFPSAPTKTPYDRLNTPVSGLGSSGQTIGRYIKGLEQSSALLSAQFPRLAELRASLTRLAQRPTAKLARVFSETLDLMSHRLDAWVTSMATVLWRAMRSQETTGVYLGGYGWIENVAPAQPARAGVALTADEQTLVAELDAVHQAAAPGAAALAPVQPPPADNGGFIHAPSAAQGAAAAILRTGYLTHQQSTNGQSLAIDLSSDRVRTALWYLDGVRQGQSLGALLGYRFEAGLLETPPLGQYIPAFRDRYPLIANKLTQPPDPSTPTESLAAPNVVDGLALLRDWAVGNLTWGNPLPDAGSNDQQGVVASLQDLTDTMDALGDLSLAESVYQIVRGNPERAGGLLAAVSRGDRPPEPQVVDTPRGGFSLTHRLLVVFPGQPPATPPWTSGSHNPRAQAEPRLDSWLRTLLPDPGRVKCWVRDDDGSASPPPPVSVTLADLDVGPLDLLAMSATADTAQLSELEQRILYQAFAAGLLPSNAHNATVTFEGALDRAQEISVPDLLVAVRAVRDMLAGARALAPTDLAAPGTAPTPPGGIPVDTNDLSQRGNAAAVLRDTSISNLQQALTALGNAIALPGSADLGSLAQAVRQALLAASWFGLSGSVPPAPGADGNSVSSVSVTLDASGTVYTLSFQTSPGGALSQSAGDTITVLAPPGTKFSASAADYTVNGQQAQKAPRLDGSAVVLTVPTDIAASTSVALVAANVMNPGPGRYTLSLVTTADKLAAVSAPYTVSGTSGSSVTALATTVATPTPGATSQYTIAFTTSAHGGLTAANGTITLLAPPGTAFSSRPGDYTVNGQTLHAPGAGSPSPVQTVGSRVTIMVPAAIAAGSQVTVIAANVINPGAHAYTLATIVTNPGVGAYGLAVSTSADPVAACDGAGYALGPLPKLLVQGATVAAALAARASLPSWVTVQSVALGASASQYTVACTTSATGSLAATVGTITLLGPRGTTFSPQAQDYAVNGVPVQLPPRVNGAKVTITVPVAVAAAAALTVVAQHVTSPAPGIYALSIATSADVWAATSAPYTIPGPGSAVSGVLAAVDPTGTTYTVSLNTSASGALSSTQGHGITLLALPGTSFSTRAADYTLNRQPVLAAPKVGAAMVTIAVPTDIPAGSQVTVVASNVTSPCPVTYTLSVSTSTDVVAAASGPYQIQMAAADWLAFLQALFGRGLLVLPRFTVPNGPELDGAFADSSQLLSGDAAAPYRWLQQLTHVRPAVSRVDLALSLVQVLGDAPSPSFAIGQLPRVPGDSWLALPLRSSVSGISVSLTPAGAAATATYAITFSVSTSGALPAGGTVTLTAPPGTILPSSGYTVVASNGHSAAVGSVTANPWPAGGPTNNQAILTLSTSTIGPGDTVTVTMPGVINPPAAGDYGLMVLTSADPQAAVSASYAVAGSGSAPAAPYTLGRISLVALTGPGYDPTASPLSGTSVCGLLLDEWPERIPNPVESTAVVFSYNEPTARAPQALLLAVNPTGAEPWTQTGYEMLLAIVEETLDLAKVRTVDLASLVNGGQFLPALYLPLNLRGDTIASMWFSF